MENQQNILLTRISETKSTELRENLVNFFRDLNSTEKALIFNFI